MGAWIASNLVFNSLEFLPTLVDTREIKKNMANMNIKTKARALNRAFNIFIKIILFFENLKVKLYRTWKF